MLNEAENELKMCKIVLEYTIFLTAILGHKKETIFFNSILNDIKISVNNNNNNDKKKIFFTFIGGAIKLFKNNKIIEENTITENDLKDDCENYINFYANINKLEKEIKKKNIN
jgi:preprotein translocase subunit SecE